MITITRFVYSPQQKMVFYTIENDTDKTLEVLIAQGAMTSTDIVVPNGVANLSFRPYDTISFGTKITLTVNGLTRSIEMPDVDRIAREERARIRREKYLRTERERQERKREAERVERDRIGGATFLEQIKEVELLPTIDAGVVDIPIESRREPDMPTIPLEEVMEARVVSEPPIKVLGVEPEKVEVTDAPIVRKERIVARKIWGWCGSVSDCSIIRTTRDECQGIWFYDEEKAREWQNRCRGIVDRDLDTIPPHKGKDPAPSWVL